MRNRVAEPVERGSAILPSVRRLPPVLLFDLDDTILAFSAPVDASWQRACAEYLAQRDSGLATQALRDAIDRAAHDFWSDAARAEAGRMDFEKSRREVVAASFDALGVEDALGACALADRYGELRERDIEPFPGAIETLGELRSRGVRLGLVTNGAAPAQRAKIDRFALAPLFDAILVEGEWGEGKPARSIFDAALDRLDAQPEDAWMVGDNLLADIHGAAQVGICTVWNDFARTGLPATAPATPDRIVTAIRELLAP